MDVWGVPGPEAEAELLAAAVAFFERVGLTSEDVGIKVNSRAVLQVVMTELGVGPEAFAPACVLVDKLEKVPLDAILGDFEAIGVRRPGGLFPTRVFLALCCWEASGVHVACWHQTRHTCGKLSKGALLRFRVHFCGE